MMTRLVAPPTTTHKQQIPTGRSPAMILPCNRGGKQFYTSPPHTMPFAIFQVTSTAPCAGWISRDVWVQEFDLVDESRWNHLELNDGPVIER